MIMQYAGKKKKKEKATWYVHRTTKQGLRGYVASSIFVNFTQQLGQINVIEI